MSYTHNGCSQIKIFTKCLTSIKSSWVEIDLVENMLLTEHFHFICTSCLWPEISKKNHISQMQSIWDRERGVWRGEIKCSLSTHGSLHWHGKPFPNFCMAPSCPSTPGGGGEAGTLVQVVLVPYTKTPTVPYCACLKLSHSFISLRLDTAGASKSFLCFFMRPPKMIRTSWELHLCSSALWRWGMVT